MSGKLHHQCSTGKQKAFQMINIDILSSAPWPLVLTRHILPLVWLVQNSQPMKAFTGIRSLPLFFLEREQKVWVNFPCQFFCQLTPELFLTGFLHCESSHPEFHKKIILWGIPKAHSCCAAPYSFWNGAIHRCKCFTQTFWKKSPITTENTGKWAGKIRCNLTLGAEFCSPWQIFPPSHSLQIYIFTSFFWGKKKKEKEKLNEKLTTYNKLSWALTLRKSNPSSLSQRKDDLDVKWRSTHETRLRVPN